MKAVAEMSVEELGALVCETLSAAGITVTLTGGSCVAIWSEGRYVSKDLDFIEEGPVTRQQVKAALAGIGFTEKKRYFEHADTEFLVEFPAGPLMVGDERVEKPMERQTAAGVLRLLSPTDCVKDRLAAFFHWNDQQALEQAVMVAHAQAVNMNDIRRWAGNEGMSEHFTVFTEKLDTPR
jgi:hypothetical protein